jgi:hypothetical protein
MIELPLWENVNPGSEVPRGINNLDLHLKVGRCFEDGLNRQKVFG